MVFRILSHFFKKSVTSVTDVKCPYKYGVFEDFVCDFENLCHTF